MKTRLLLADDHAITRYGLRVLLELSGMEVIGEVGEGREAVQLAQAQNPDVVIMDVTMPGLNGIEATAMLKSRCPNTKIIILSMHADAEHIHRALSAGASGYLLKGAAGSEVIKAVTAVIHGRQYLSQELEALEMDALKNANDSGPLASLSTRERQVLQLVAEGYSSAKIASLIFLSPKSVDTYRSRLMKKLGVSDVTGLIKFAVQHGLTPAS